MAKEQLAGEEKAIKKLRAESGETVKRRAGGPAAQLPGLAGLQRRVGNRAVQRLLAQRSQGPAELDDETATRINRERGGGQPLDGALQARAGDAMGHDLSAVRVHTSPEAGDLSRQLNARAFTTGRDVFFREGAYEPHSSAGQELIAHELTHVVQQGLRSVGGGSSRMNVNPPGDVYEQEADAVAKTVTSASAGGQLQRQGVPEEEEEKVQTQAGEEEEEEEIQMQVEEEEEEPVQTQVAEQEEELAV